LHVISKCYEGASLLTKPLAFAFKDHCAWHDPLHIVELSMRLEARGHLSNDLGIPTRELSLAQPSDRKKDTVSNIKSGYFLKRSRKARPISGDGITSTESLPKV